jgi:hypothetical protein
MLEPALGPSPSSGNREAFESWNDEHGFAWRVIHDMPLTVSDRERLASGECADPAVAVPDPPGWRDHLSVTGDGGMQ